MTSSPSARAAFEITKGDVPVPFLAEREVIAALQLPALIDELAGGFADVERGVVQSPPRPEITVPGAGFSLAMMAWRPGAQICVKVVNVFDANLAVGRPNHLALITLYDPTTGAVSGVLDGTYITGVRTAAAAALSIRLLARPDARVATIVGAGVQAREHLRCLPLVRDLDRINVCSLDPEHAARLAALDERAVARTDLATAVGESDVVCLTTHSPSAVIEAAWVRAGTHVTSVGYCPPDGELPRELTRDHRVFVESRDAFEPAPVGCGDLSHAPTGTTLGAVVLGEAEGRRAEDEITVYKAMGIAMEDLVAANLVFDAVHAVRTHVSAQQVTW